MAMEINIVDYPSKKFGIIRAGMIDGEPYFVGKDVAKALGYKNTKDAIIKHVDLEDKGGRESRPPLKSGNYSN